MNEWNLGSSFLLKLKCYQLQINGIVTVIGNHWFRMMKQTHKTIQYSYELLLDLVNSFIQKKKVKLNSMKLWCN